MGKNNVMTGNWKSNSQKGASFLTDWTAAYSHDLLALHLEQSNINIASGHAPIAMRWTNAPDMFCDDEHPLRPSPTKDLEAAISETIVKLAVIDVLMKSGCEKRREATRKLQDALGLENKRANELFDNPSDMSTEQVEKLARATDSTIGDLRGVDTDAMRLRQLDRITSTLNWHYKGLKGARLNAAVEILLAATNAIEALNVKDL